MIEMYDSREQPDDLQRRDRGLAAGAGQPAESEWSQLIGILELAQRWQDLIGEFIGEDANPDGADADDVRSASRCSNNSQRKQSACAQTHRSSDAKRSGGPERRPIRQSQRGLIG